MTIHNLSELTTKLADNSFRRKQELCSIEILLGKSGAQSPLYRRAAVALAYAHWEGFVKHAASAYVALVAHKSRRLCDFSANFQALACRGLLISAQPATRRFGPHMEVVARLVDGLASSVTVPTDGAIDTESNLGADVFANLCGVVGVDYTARWQVHAPRIDGMIVSRCLVAHGDLYVPDANYALECVTFSKSAIDWFTADIENAAATEAYLRPAARSACTALL